jgi:hypothetical protein
MKIITYILIALFFVLIIGYCTVMHGLSKTTWGGWRPEEPEFILSENEQHWEEATEEKYDILFTDIMLDPSFMEDSIIYMTIWVNDSSSLQRESCDSTSSITAISKSYMNAIRSERPQKFIELSLENLWFACDGKRLKYTTTRTYLFGSAQNSILQQPDN